MQDTTGIIRIILLLTTFAVMGIGVWKDTKERRYPNSIILVTMILGLIYATVSGHLFESIFGFMIMNIIGVFLYKYNLMASGDSKYLSSLFLFISLLDIKTCLILIIYMLIVGFTIGKIFYSSLNKNMKDELKYELFAYKALVLYRINTFKIPEFDNKDELLTKTIAFTVPMYIAFVLTILTQLIIKCI